MKDKKHSLRIENQERIKLEIDDKMDRIKKV
jgi:hypothetical protein